MEEAEARTKSPPGGIIVEQLVMKRTMVMTEHDDEAYVSFAHRMQPRSTANDDSRSGGGARGHSNFCLTHTRRRRRTGVV